MVVNIFVQYFCASLCIRTVAAVPQHPVEVIGRTFFHATYKSEWRGTVRAAIDRHRQQSTRDGTCDQSLERFLNIQSMDLHIHPLWLAERVTKGHRKHFRDIKLNCVPCHSRSVIVCLYCNCEVTVQLVHYLPYCSKYKNTRESVVNTFHVNVSTYLLNLCESEQTKIFLGKRPSIFIDEGELYKLREICARARQILANEPELRFY